MTHGIYLCRVKGLKYCDFIVLKYDDDDWWLYVQDNVNDIEGWVGNNLEIVEVVQLIEELNEE